METTSLQIPPPSDWVVRWTGLIPEGSDVLDVACGRGRHMKWLHTQGISAVGVDRDPLAVASAAAWGQVHQADIENAHWPLTNATGGLRQFGSVLVTNYLWRQLFPTLLESVAHGGVLIYETFADGNQLFGKPSRPDFLLKPGELLEECAAHGSFQVVAYEYGVLPNPDRCVQRIVAVKTCGVVRTQHCVSEKISSIL